MATSQIIDISLHGSTVSSNHAPQFAANPTISGSIVEGMVLTVSYTASGTPVPTASYQWKSNGSNVGTNAATYTTVSGDIAHTITCTVTLNNGVGSPVSATSPPTAPIQSPPAAPMFTINPAISGGTTVNSQLTATYAATGNPVPTPAYQWKSAGSNVGINSSTYTAQNSDVGNTITCTITLTNGVGSPAVVTSAAFGPITTANQAPAFAVGGNPSVTGSLVQGQQLTVTYVATGNPIPTPAYQWKSNGSNVGTNAATYMTVAGDVGHTITCQVTLTNGVGSPAVATSPAVGPITASSNAPAFTSGPSVTGSVIQGNTLTVSYTATGAPTPTPAYQWKSNGSNVGTNASTYATVIGDVGHTITCQVTLTNGVGSPAVATSAATAPIQSATGASNPTVAVVTLPDNSIPPVTTMWTFDAAAGVDIGSYVDPNGRFTMTCKRITQAGCPIYVDYRAIAAQNWACFVFYYADWRNTNYVNLRAYSVNMGGTVVSLPGHWAQSRWRQCFLNGVAGTAQACWPFALNSSPSTLSAAGLAPSMDAAIANGTAQDLVAYYGGVPAYSPMGMAGMVNDMSAQGGRPDIGVVSGPQGQFLSGGPNTASMLNMIFNWGEAGASFPLYFVDKTTNAVIDAIVSYPNAGELAAANPNPQLYAGPVNGQLNITATGPSGTVIQGQGAGPNYNLDSTHQVYFFGNYTIPGGGTGTATITVYNKAGLESYDPGGGVTLFTTDDNGNTINAYPGVTFTTVANSFIPGSQINIDDAHMPPAAYIPFVFTGDPYYLETLQAQAIHAYLAQPPWNYGISGVNPFPGANQMRQLAWNLRQIMQSAYMTPASVPSWLLPKSLFATGLENFRQGIIQLQANGAATQSIFHTLYAPSADHLDSWQADYLTSIVCWTSVLFPAWVPQRNFFVSNLNDRILGGDGTAGWCGANPTFYEVHFYTQASEASWQALWAANIGNWTGASGPSVCYSNFSTAVATIGTTENNGIINDDYVATMMAALKIARWSGDTTTSSALSFIAPQVATYVVPSGLLRYGYQQVFS